MDQMDEQHRDFLRETRRQWQPYSQEELTTEDAQETIDSVAAYFGMLAKWARRDTTNGQGQDKKNSEAT